MMCFILTSMYFYCLTTVTVFDGASNPTLHPNFSNSGLAIAYVLPSIITLSKSIALPSTVTYLTLLSQPTVNPRFSSKSLVIT